MRADDRAGIRRRGSRVRGVGAAGALTLAVLATACSVPPGPANVGGGGPSPEPGTQPVPARECAQPATSATQFERVDPRSVGMDPAAVAAAIENAAARGGQSVRVYRHNCLIGTSANDAATEWSQMTIWSMTKGIVSTIVGRAVTLGLISVDDTVGEYIPGLGEQQSKITVRQLLNQNSGLRFAWANDVTDAGLSDSGRLVFDRPVVSQPGTKWVYGQTAVTGIVAVLESAIGEDIQSFAQREVFGPIGIARGDWDWQRDGAGRSHGFAGIQMTPLAVSRIGSLLLEDGMWNGERVLSSEYIAQAKKGTADNPGYGFLWWTNEGEWHRQTGYVPEDVFPRRWVDAAPEDTFGFTGMLNQNVFVIPSLDIVVVRIGTLSDAFPDPLGDIQGKRPGWTHRFFSLLLPGVTDVDLPVIPEWEPDPVFVPVDLESIFFFNPAFLSPAFG